MTNSPNQTPSTHCKQPRRTLDEYFYSGLRQTKARNKGQTVSKWTGEEEKMPEDGRLEASNDSLVAMVDQIWIWALDES